jgi:ABC-type transport system involved in multi-copper enzyme maturation permease subunit
MSEYRSAQPAGHDGLWQLIRAEWTKFRTVRGWVIGTFLAAVLMVGLSLTGAAGSKAEACDPQGCHIVVLTYPSGPSGEPVTDIFYLVHRTLDGNGTLTVGITSLAGEVLQPGPGGPQPAATPTTQGLQPWAKAGLIIEASTRQGAAYAAVMVTGSHGVRMQYDYVNDVPGMAGKVSATSPRWLRLTRAGDTVTAYDSANDEQWLRVGAVTLPLGSKVQAGAFVTSPAYFTQNQHVGGSSGTAQLTLAEARFEDLVATGAWLSDRWVGSPVGANTNTYPAAVPNVVNQAKFAKVGGAFTVTGSGDIAPATGIPDSTETSLVGSFLALIVLIILATLFITSEYRRGLIQTTLAASPRRGRVLAAKAIVIAAVTFVVGAVAAAVTIPIFNHIWTENGNTLFPIGAATEARVIVGTALLLALCSVLALAIGTVLRRSAGAVTSVIVLVVLPFILTRGAVLPAGVADWVLRLTPAAAFAVQQTIPAYSQVPGFYTPAGGYFPLGAWAGLAVMCAYCAVALGGATVLLLRRDV